MHAAAILQGLREVEDPFETFTPNGEDPVTHMQPYERVLPPLWARSGTRIANAIESPTDLEYLRLSVMARRLTPRLYMRALDVEVNLDIAIDWGRPRDSVAFSTRRMTAKTTAKTRWI